ncbi:MAG TPA: response regulator [Aliidongia sp.]|nr:response regulator [Aliidongia sp.]
MSAPASKRRVLLVEDEGMIAMLIEDLLIDIDCEVAATAAQLDEAVKAAETGAFDFAIVDVNLSGKSSYPVAAILKSRGIPFLFATGYGTHGLSADYAETPTLQKPFMRADLSAAVERLLSPV